MGTCVYCGQPAGFLRRKHAKCEDEHAKRERLREGGRLRIQNAALKAVTEGSNLNDLEVAIQDIERVSFVPTTDRVRLLVAAWEQAVEKFLDDGLLEEREEQLLMTFKDKFNLSQTELDKRGGLTRITKAAALRDVMEGKVPERVQIEQNMGVNLQKGEKIAWAFPSTQYFEDKTRRQYAGASKGLSIRIAKGVYFKTSAFKGAPVDHTERTLIGSGWLILTNQNIYFVSPQKTLKVPFKKVISFEPFSNGFGISRDAATAKPQLFATGDGWFSYNLAVNLAQLSTENG